MAALSMGSFGAYKQAYSRHMERQKAINEGQPDSNEVVWVLKRYVPTDLRHTAPVPRYKVMAGPLPVPPQQYVPYGEASLNSFSRENGRVFASAPSTRCEEWSTLKQMVPSTGRPHRINPPNWGTGLAPPPPIIGTIQKRFPHVNSPMTRYTDDMHLTNRLFKLH